MTGDICQGRCACYVLCVSSDPRKSCSMSISIRIDVLHFGQQHWCVLEFSIRCGSCSTSERLLLTAWVSEFVGVQVGLAFNHRVPTYCLVLLHTPIAYCPVPIHTPITAVFLLSPSDWLEALYDIGATISPPAETRTRHFVSPPTIPFLSY